MKIIYEHTRPTFAILADDLQWILAKRKTESKGEVMWKDRSYFPKLSLLLDELAENQFRRQPKKLNELMKLDESIVKVYRLIDEVSQDVQEAAEQVFRG